MASRFRVTGPKGGTIIRSASSSRIAKTLPALVKRFRRITVAAAPSSSSPTPAELRRRILAYCHWAIAHEPAIHYAQSRPIPILHRRTLPLSTDCSGLATCAYADAGAPDPNGCKFNGSGYTGTMLSKGREISKRQARAGDLVVFGHFPGHHVAVLLEDGDAHGGDPLLCSHGQERGPLAIRLSAEQRYQPMPATFLTYLGG